ncbi:MAG: HD domain-containing protein [Treponemataceae bacterium]
MSKTQLLSRELILKLFEAFSIQRWNDFIRPIELTEMDRASEKMFLAFFIGKLEEKKGNKINWQEIIEGSVFEVFRRVLLSDIKSPVQRMIRQKFPDEFVKINKWIFDSYSKIIHDKEFLASFYDYLFNVPKSDKLSRMVLRAAHKYATVREFEILRIVNEPARLGKVEEYLKSDMAEFSSLEGLQDFLPEGKSYQLIIELEKLRFQERWNQSPRVPKTSVLGHSFFVALLTLLMSKSLKHPAHRQYNNFFAALFHDLPEAVTRDIISPVKRATNYLPEALRQIEALVVEDELFPLMDECYIPELKHYLTDEFENKIFVDGCTQVVSFEYLEKHSTAEFKPVDGKLVRLVDHIVAFVEADRSISYGISSEHLVSGRKSILDIYCDQKNINGFDASELFVELDGGIC